MALAIENINKISPWTFTVATIIPAWKEPIIAKVLAKFNEPLVDEIILVIDEPSQETENLINLIKTKIKPKLTIIRNHKRMGIGYAIRQGLTHALEKGYEVVVVMAGNGKDDPKEIPRLLKKIEEGYDYVQGSRYLPGGKCNILPISRRVFNKLWPLIWTILTKKRQTEVTNGFRAYKTKILRDPRININQKWLNHYALEYYIHYKAIKLGYKHCEVPVSKTYPWAHKGGYSKIMPLKDWIHIILPPILLWLRIKK